MTIEFREPPPKWQGRAWMVEAVAALRERPGEWALVRHYLSRTSTSPVVARLRDRGCEATTRSTADGGVDIYARWPE